ncbi:hypothetical protein ACXYTP_23785 [Tsukamurella ocularis]
MTKRFFIFDARGTTEPYEGNMLGHVIALVRRAHPDVRVEHVVHAASISLNNATRDPLAPSGNNSANQIVAWLRARIAQLGPDDRYIVLGYSLGAVGTARHLKLYGGDHRCLMYGNIASPSRRAGTIYGLPEGLDHNPMTRANDRRSGIYATQGTGTAVHSLGTAVPLVEIANPSDVMTSCPAVSPLHAFAGPVMAFDFRRPGDLVEQLREGGIEDIVENLANVGNWANPRWWTWIGDLAAFMQRTHTLDYGLPMWRDSANRPVSGIELLARQIAWRISREKAIA